MDVKELTAIADKLAVLKQALDEKPELLEFLRLLKEQDCDGVARPVMLDPLVTAGVAAKMLCVSKGAVYRMAEKGLLHVWKTPNSNLRKFKVSEINSIPQMVERGKAS